MYVHYASPNDSTILYSHIQTYPQNILAGREPIPQ